MAALKEMVVADASLFHSSQNFHQQAAHDVVVAMMASDEKTACDENPRVLGHEGEGGSDRQQKFNLGSSLSEQEQIRVLPMLEENVDRFAFSMEDIEPFKGEPMQLELNSEKPIFRPPHKLGQVCKDVDFVSDLYNNSCAILMHGSFT